MNYRSIENLNQIILHRLFILPHDFDLIVGIPRSGMFPAALIALYLNTRLTDLDSFKNKHIYDGGERNETLNYNDIKKVLIVDDSISSGAQLQKCKESLMDRNNIEIKYAVIYGVPNMEKEVDYFFECLPLPRLFQWNILNHNILKKSCMDIDGVLCVDPTEAQNDDGERYIDFIKNAIPLYIPKKLIGTLVTSRLEKYRPQTEAWLEKHGVQYCKLIMMKAANQEERIQINGHAVHKAHEYKKAGYNLFIESSLQQAIQINILTKKPVLCTENFKIINEQTSLFYAIKSGEKLPLIKKTLLKIKKIKKTILHH
ncbi:MAG: phosphoribosyltransferase family protein [Bacteroidaceae bacterium]